MTCSLFSQHRLPLPPAPPARGDLAPGALTMSTKDTTEVAGESTIQVPTLDTTFLSPCPVARVVPGFPALLVSVPPVPWIQPFALGQHPKPSFLVPSREQPPPEDLSPQEAVGMSSSMSTAASRAAAVEYK